jgi:hypothetical protein
VFTSADADARVIYFYVLDSFSADSQDAVLLWAEQQATLMAFFEEPARYLKNLRQKRREGLMSWHEYKPWLYLRDDKGAIYFTAWRRLRPDGTWEYKERVRSIQETFEDYQV